MSIGWFDAFRENGAPTWYGENRSPVFVDFQILAILAAFAIPIVAYLLICFGIRRYKWISTFSFLFFMAIGLIILVAIYSPFWHSGRVHIYTTYKAFTNAKLNATLAVKIGLKHLNITLTNKDSNQFSLLSLIYEDDHEVDLNYNERFEFSDVSSMERELEHALYKGLPYPILKVIEYLSVDRAGFVWGRQYRLAGYYTFVLLWLAFACWLLQFVMLILVPHYFAKIGLLVSATTLVGDLVYFLNTPSNLYIRYPAPGDKLAVLTFNPSYSFYLTFGAGVASLIFYGLIFVLQSYTSFRFQTIFSSRMDDNCGIPQKISLPRGCPAESASESNSSSLNRSVSTTCRNSESPSTLSCSIELETDDHNDGL